MGQHLIKALLLVTIALSAASCVLKQPGDELGNPVSADEVYAALDEAMNVPQSKVYRVGDSGTIQEIDAILGNSAINYTLKLSVDEITSDFIFYTQTLLETGDVKKFKIPVEKPVTTTAKVAKNIQRVFASVKKLFNKIQITTSTAMGQELKRPYSLSQKVNFNKIPNAIILEKSYKAELSKKGFSTSDDDFTSQYFGLNVTKHLYTTMNCSQIFDCKVNATRIEFNEVQTYSDGQIMKLRRVLEISKEVPGLFMALEVCLSTVLVDGEQQIPLTRCNKVRGFKFGTGQQTVD